MNLLLIVVLAIVSFVGASGDVERELEILTKLYAEDASPLEPEETLKYLKELEPMYRNESKSDVEDKELGREIIGLSLKFADLKPEFCDEDRFYNFRNMADVLTSFPNMLKFIKHYEAKQLALCEEHQPGFEVDFAKIDARVAADA